MLNKKTRDPRTDYLFKAILTLETVDECYEFFEDLCTISEIQEMSRRILAAKMLQNNKVYAEIAEETGLSTATISRVNKCLKYGSEGYIKALERLSYIERAEKKRYE
jgi:TrpR-related protein YerC/YecD